MNNRPAMDRSLATNAQFSLKFFCVRIPVDQYIILLKTTMLSLWWWQTPSREIYRNK
eukprot:CCRYP_015508-RC/>CCRYP_015508-RC protein AED:0.47 eAED:0.47 QI:9/1/1/1/0/0/3/173/56